MKKLYAFLLLFAPSVFSSASTTAKTEPIRIVGSATVTALSQRLTEWYAKKYPYVSFHVESVAPTQGFSALIEGRGEIAQSARKALDGEVLALRSRRNLEFVEVPIATEYAAIVVHSSNRIQAVSIYDLRQVLSGSIRNWKDVGGSDAPIHLYGLDSNSEVRNLLDEQVLGDASFTSSIRSLPSNGAVLSAVATDPSGLGFCNVDLHTQLPIRYLGIKPSVAAEAIEPTGDNIRAHRYKLSRILYYYFAGRPSPELFAFTEWVLSSEGQLVVEAVGFYPLGQVDREQARRILRESGTNGRSAQ